MADIVELGQMRGACDADRSKKAGLGHDVEADIIIFPGVRYDRENMDRSDPVAKKRVLRKPKAP